LRPRYLEATPYKHIVIDDFLPKDVLRRLIDEFPKPDDPKAKWEQHGPGRTTSSKNKEGDKLATSDETTFGPFTRHFMAQLNSDTFLRFISMLTGVKGLLADPGYGGCGLHSTGAGGRLMIHTDVNRHTVPSGHIHQILNAILYLNEDWKEEYGGHLELWNRERKLDKAILPTANRLVLFSTGSKSLHGHPKPLTPPEGRRRNSLAVYYYVLDRPSDDDYVGFQTDVSWIPSEPEDFQFIERRTQAVLGKIAQLHETVTLFPKVWIPAGFIPDALMSRLPEQIPLLFLDWGKFADKERFVERHLSGCRVPTVVDQPELSLSRLHPFAMVGLSDPKQILEVSAMLLLVDPADGRAYLCRGPNTELTWVGYAEGFVPLAK
jgi:Rps23 Pro-64 3,4-dihydroxylase Tpa1-like proline 4-hydroxylase